ncbi:hypothetical protein BUALT_Bualt14G0108700 [Buddleja alternifolia]|uniref:Cellulose synthase-like protein G2 n=1 Tax=Buddleja alternifolia TaxID=168488 RepID=A0AAV6WJT4_9LAMI|nr:hypothetical protein BUALT_Bualt14G0108700 [Buddleja alternifolia]
MGNSSLPLNDYHINKTHVTLNRLYMFIHGIFLSSLFYYRFTTLNDLIKTSSKTLLPHVLILISELIITFIWVLNQASKWRPVTRTVYPDRLPEDEKLPSIDVFICTADPNKEPTVGVMNTLISAMALDYPPDKISVYLSDDGGSNVTFRAIKEAWKFSEFWIPFCRKYWVNNRCPEAYFSSTEESGGDDLVEFVAEKKKIEKRYDEFKDSVLRIVADTSTCVSRDHPPIIEVINGVDPKQKEMPLLVYVAREKRPSHPHHFKAGALNVLVGFRYFAVVEDYFTGLNLHCEGWISVYLEPSRPCFLGASPISLSDILVQNTRWYVGLMQVGLSKFSPLLYGPMRMSTLQSMCYAEFAYTGLYFVPLYILAVVPQLCLVYGIPLYPEVSSPFFFVFSFIFLSYQLKHLQEIFSSGHSLKAWSNEQRIWAMKCLTSYMYASLDATMEKIGLTKAIFLPTNKVVDDEQTKRYQMGIYDFQASALFMVPLCSLYILNVASFIIGLVKILQSHKGNEMIVQAFIPFFITILFFPLLEGMVIRKDKGRISPFVSLVSTVVSIVVLSFVSLVNY